MGMKLSCRNTYLNVLSSRKSKEEWEHLVDHHYYSVTLLQELSIDTQGPLPKDEFGMRYIILNVDNFSKFVGLYLVKTVSTLEFVRAFLSWIGNFGVPKVLRSDGRSQLSSDVAERLQILLKYQYIIVFSYHSQANSIAERRGCVSESLGV